MTYRVYIRDYSKAEVRQSNFPRSLSPKINLAILTAAVCAYFIVPTDSEDSTLVQPVASVDQTLTNADQPRTVPTPSHHPISPSPEQTITVHTDEATGDIESFVIEIPTQETEIAQIAVKDEPTYEVDTAAPATPVKVVATQESLPVIDIESVGSKLQTAKLSTKDELLGILAEQKLKQPLAQVTNDKQTTVQVRPGDSMALIFQRLGLSATELHAIMALGQDTRPLKSLRPGQNIEFTLDGNSIQQLRFDYRSNKTLLVDKIDGKYAAQTVESEIEREVRYANAVIDSSLFMAGQSSGIDDQTIMNLVSIYGWDIDFALDIRKGDKFALIYEEHYVKGKKIGNGPILAAEFINDGHRYRAVRYTHENGDVNYYSDTGHNMRKAFMRTPVNFSRISSHFNLRRKHPVLNTIRAHKGVDYAARTGTPIKATGDGVVVHKGTKGGYGRTVILKHGGKYTTLYAHMSKYAGSVKVGTRVKQGQTIGYVGSSGLATGPHLHYEFRVNGVHRNPLKVKLPKALKIPDAIMADFTAQTQPILAQLDEYINQSNQVASLSAPEDEKATYLAMRKSESAESIAQ